MSSLNEKGTASQIGSLYTEVKLNSFVFFQTPIFQHFLFVNPFDTSY